MAEQKFQKGQRVEVTGKDVKGVVAFIGSTTFAAGKWIGVVLDCPKGKNNGTVQGKTYFQCDENCGMFVRASQLTSLEPPSESAAATPSPSGIARPSRGSIEGGSSLLDPARARSSLRKKIEPTRLPVPGINPKSMAGDGSAELSVTPIKETAQASDSASKRASFVETGFVETLKPQYTPGPALSPGIGFNVEERLTNLQQATEIDRLNAVIRDLNEKFETLRVKRSQDKEKLKEQDKLRLQLEQLLEFKTSIMDKQSTLQRELNRARMEAREAIEAKERHAEEMADLAETVEMATLDKEMAEEKAETLQLELDQATERIEMLTMDLELLRADTGNTDGDTKSSVNALEVKQLEHQNARLRETLVKLRDLSAHEKHEAHKLQKELDVRRSEIAELSRTKEKLSARQEEMEQQIADLQEQVDAALGSEEMLENLTTKNLTLEERVKELEEAVADLEAISDMNEQLQENSRELELELREELDMAHAARREAQRERDAAQETLGDRELTINKFRELVQRLQEQNNEIQEQLQRETSRPVTALPEMIDFKKMFAESKAHTKAIDLELRRLDVQQATQHAQYLTTYMPESFMSRGGDHDAILMLLLLPRLLRKADLVVEQVRDKFPEVGAVQRAALLSSHAVEQFAFRSRLSFWVYSLQSVLQRLQRALLTCNPETLLRVGVLYADLVLQERAVDALVELLRRDQLDENVSLKGLERCVEFCLAIASTHLPPSAGPSNIDAQQLRDSCKALTAACDSIYMDTSSVLALMQGGAVSEGVGQLLRDLATGSDALRQQLKQCRRRLPQEGANIGKLSEHGPAVSVSLDQASRLMLALHQTCRACLQSYGTHGEPATPSPDAASLELGKVLELLQMAAEAAYESAEGADTEQSPLDSIRGSLAGLQATVSALALAAQEGDYELDLKKEEKVVAPIVLRAQSVKKELEETKMLKQKLETRETDIKEIKKALKLKQEELSEMVIRKDLAESKLGNVHKDYAHNMEKLQRKLDDSQMMLRRKEKEFEETMDHLQADIDSLESERGELKEKVKIFAKRAEGLARNQVSSVSSSLVGQSGPSLPVAVRDSPMLMQQVQDLRLALRHAHNETLRLKIASAKTTMEKLPPLSVGTSHAVEKDSNLCDLSKKAASLLKELQSVSSCPAVVDVSSRKTADPPVLDKMAPMHKLVEEHARLQALCEKTETLKGEVIGELMQRKRGARSQSQFADFPTVELAKALLESKPRCVGRVTLHGKTKAPSTPHLPLVLDLQALRQLHTKFVS